jgi:hypothetical protein
VEEREEHPVLRFREYLVGLCVELNKPSHSRAGDTPRGEKIRVHELLVIVGGSATVGRPAYLVC